MRTNTKWNSTSFKKTRTKRKDFYIMFCLQLPPVAMATDIRRNACRGFMPRSPNNSRNLQRDNCFGKQLSTSCCIKDSTLELFFFNPMAGKKELQTLRSIQFRKWSKFDQHHTSHKTQSMLTSPLAECTDSSWSDKLNKIARTETKFRLTVCCKEQHRYAWL